MLPRPFWAGLLLVVAGAPLGGEARAQVRQVKRVVAVGTIEGQGEVTALLAGVVQDFMVNEMRKDPRFAQVLSPDDVDTRLQQDGLPVGECGDDPCRAEQAGMVGADSAVFGQLREEGQDLVLSLTLMDTERRQIIDSAQHRVLASQEEALLDALPPVLGVLFGAFDRMPPPDAGPPPQATQPIAVIAQPPPAPPPPAPVFAPQAAPQPVRMQPPPAPPGPDFREPGEEPPGFLSRHWGSVLTFTIAAAAGGTGAAFYMLSRGNAQDANELIARSQFEDVSALAPQNKEDTADTQLLVSRVLGGVAVAGLVTGVILALTEPSAEEAAAGGLSISTTPGGLGVAFGGTF